MANRIPEIGELPSANGSTTAPSAIATSTGMNK
jgi:hypothetical protein